MNVARSITAIFLDHPLPRSAPAFVLYTSARFDSVAAANLAACATTIPALSLD